MGVGVKDLVGKLALVAAVFVVLLLMPGAGFGRVEMSLWCAALTGSLAFVVWRHGVRKRNV